MDISTSSLITILALITVSLLACSTFAGKLINFLQDIRKDKKLKEEKENLQQSQNELQNACENGDLSDLVNASKKLGKTS